MNMISTGAFLNEMDASNKQSTAAEKFAAVWEKKNAKAARAGGVSLMALSLAACGSSSTTTTSTTTTTDTTTTTPATDAAMTLKLTAVADTATGGSGNDTIDGYSVSESYSAADTIDGGAGTDTLIIHTAVAQTPITSNVEVLSARVTANKTITLNKMDGLTSVINESSTGNLTLSKFTTAMDLTVQNTAAKTTTVTATGVTGTADALTVAVNGDNGALTADGYETMTITGSTYAGSTGASLDATDSNTLKSITITGSALTDLGEVRRSGSDENKHITIDGSGATGGFKADISAFDGTVTGGVITGNTVTGSAAADTISLDADDIDKYETLTMGAGDDTLKIMTEANDSGGHALASGDFANITGFTRLELAVGTDAATGGNSLSLSTDTGLEWAKTIVLGANKDFHFDNVQGNTTFEVSKDATVADLTTASFVAGTHATTIDMKGGATLADANVTNAGTLTINSVGASSNKITALTDSTGGTLVITGTADLDLDDAALATAMATVNAADFTGALTVQASASASNITGGSGNDTLKGGAAADIINGGAGNDTITGGAASDVINAGAGNDTVVVVNHATQYDTITLGAGSDHITYDGAATALASVVVKDFDFGTSTTTVDYITIDQSDLNLVHASGTDTVLTDTDGTTIVANAALTVKTVTTDGALITGADIVVLSQTYASEAAALTGMSTAGSDTFAHGSLGDHDSMLVAYSDGTNSYLALAWQATGSATTTSDGFEAVDNIFTFEGVTDLTLLNGSDILIV